MEDNSTYQQARRNDLGLPHFYTGGISHLPAYSDSDVSDDESSVSSMDDSSARSNSSPFPMTYRDSVQRRSPFRLPRDMDPTQTVYEGWTVYIPQNEKDPLSIRVAPTSHSQQELSEMHLAALDKYHGTHRSSASCLPVRRLVNRATRRPTYDEHIDGRVVKCCRALQAELSYLLDDRSRHSSSSDRERMWTVAMLQEQLCPRFASTKPTPAKRHRLRWWKDNTRGRETELFVVILGRETRHEPGGIPMYSRYTNPWRAVDEEQTIQEKEVFATERGQGFVAPPPSTRRSQRSFPRPIVRRRDAPLPTPFAPMVSQGPRFDAFPGRPPFVPSPPRPLETGFQQNAFYLPPPPPAPAHPRWPQSGPPPTYRATPTPPMPTASGPLGFVGPDPELGWNFEPSSPRNFAAFFPTSSGPPSLHWPRSPSSHANVSRPLSVYGPPPTPHAYSNLTTPSTLSSIHVPMFGPIPPAPPAVSRSPSPPYWPRRDWDETMRDEKCDSVRRPSTPTLGGSHLHQQDTQHTAGMEPKEEAKSLAKEKPAGMRGDE